MENAIKAARDGVHGKSGAKSINRACRDNKPFNESELVIMDCLNAGGKLTIKDLVSSTGFSNRKVRRVILGIIVNHRIPIGSCSDQAAGGYFLIDNKEELAIATKELRGRIRELAKRAAALEDISEAALYGQLNLEAGGAE